MEMGPFPRPVESLTRLLTKLVAFVVCLPKSWTNPLSSVPDDHAITIHCQWFLPPPFADLLALILEICLLREQKEWLNENAFSNRPSEKVSTLPLSLAGSSWILLMVGTSSYKFGILQTLAFWIWMARMLVHSFESIINYEKPWTYSSLAKKYSYYECRSALCDVLKTPVFIVTVK